jgi:hypothetical protein
MSRRRITANFPMQIAWIHVQEPFPPSFSKGKPVLERPLKISDTMLHLPIPPPLSWLYRELRSVHWQHRNISIISCQGNFFL